MLPVLGETGAVSGEDGTAPPAEVVMVDAEESVDPGMLAPSLFRIASRKLSDGFHEDARTALYQLIELRPDGRVELDALLLLADSYRKSNNPSRAAAILERILQDRPRIPEIPRVLLTLGRTYREMGAESLALARFYSVLNATLKLDPDQLEEYQLIARTAQFEIAETHLGSGRYEEASKYFQRLSLFDLAAEDHARARFKTAHAAYLGANFRRAADQLEAFLSEHPEDPAEPEARFLLSVSLEQLGRHDEALAVALTLFDEARMPADGADTWRYWQRRTGNQLANEFFHKGRMQAAHALYSRLASLSEEPGWRAPALYQVALSAERLGNLGSARDAYEEVVALAKVDPRLQDLASMAEWRRAHLDWAYQFEAQQRRLLGPDPVPPSLAAGDSSHGPEAFSGS